MEEGEENVLIVPGDLGDPFLEMDLLSYLKQKCTEQQFKLIKQLLSDGSYFHKSKLSLLQAAEDAGFERSHTWCYNNFEEIEKHIKKWAEINKLF